MLADGGYNNIKKSDNRTAPIVAFGRDEATRTPDPYVPNVVRYQLRYIPICEIAPSASYNASESGAKLLKKLDTLTFFQKYLRLVAKKHIFANK